MHLRMTYPRILFLTLLMLSGVFSSRLIAQCTFPRNPSSKLLSYSFEPVIVNGRLNMKVSLAFDGGSKGEDELKVPSESEGQQHLEKAIINLKAESAGAALRGGKSVAERVIQYPPGSKVV